MPAPTRLERLNNGEPCGRCAGTLLPGRRVPFPAVPWGVISDLPESFSGFGVLYSTRPTLPANGAPATMLAQRSAAGFDGIRGSFDVFHFHLNKETTGAARIVVYVRNVGTKPVTVAPQQVIKSEGMIGTVHEFESAIARRVLDGDWDHPVRAAVIPAGEGRVVAYGKQFGAAVRTEGPDASHNVNCFGYTRVEVVKGNREPLEVSVVAIPAAEAEKNDAAAKEWAERGAASTDEVAMGGEPKGCALGRAVGTYRNFRWVAAPAVFDVTALDAGGTSFPMALPLVQSAGCPGARQTGDLVRRPGYTREDTVGNYMIENEVVWTLTNPSGAAALVEPVFGKSGADVGLAYRWSLAAGTKPAAIPMGQKSVSRWAGPRQKSRQVPFLDTPVSIPAHSARTLRLVFMVVGNSSLPFDLGIRAVPGAAGK